MKAFVLFFIMLSSSIIFPQKYLERQLAGNIPADQLVTLSPNVTFNQAIELLNKVSIKATGKKIVSTFSSDEPIDIELTNMAYDKALVVLVQMKGLMVETHEDVSVIKKKTDIDLKQDRTSENYASVNEREVKISAVFFEGDVNSEKKRGIDWNMLFSKGDWSVGGNVGNTTLKSVDGSFDFNASTKFNAGGLVGDATAIFRLLETEDLGEIIANPSITTRDRKKGRIQVGSDFSIKQKDFAGNIIESFFATGSIIEVTPYIYNEDGVDYILLDIKVERSSFVPGTTTTEVRKSSASSQVVLLNGEETIIGGLFINDETTVRSGVPFLKDLPWWVFGLRYIFGSDDVKVAKKELVISIKAELVPTLKERLAGPKEKNVIKEDINKKREQFKLYQFNQQDDKVNNNQN